MYAHPDESKRTKQNCTFTTARQRDMSYRSDLPLDPSTDGVSYKKTILSVRAKGGAFAELSLLGQGQGLKKLGVFVLKG